MRNISDKIRRENQNTDISLVIFFSEKHPFYGIRNVVKYGEYNTTHAHCMLDDLGYRNTHM